ncbi:hypothetical protein SDC9_65955 [bioreactor metagenome]|uniref:Uncharacterized protein n=1 Tax=bioreactor metagenome TaxID=1076179 RepID=A0A644XTW5_9ZZZZ
MHPSDNGSNTKITGTYKSNGLFIPDRIMTPSELSRATADTAPAKKAAQSQRGLGRRRREKNRREAAEPRVGDRSRHREEVLPAPQLQNHPPGK